MKSKIARIILSLALLATALGGVLNATPAMADAPPQTSLTIIKYAENGTVLGNTTVTYEYLRDNLPVQGDGVTHYYTEGPTFDPANLWDPDEICPNDSLKDKGALKGTDLKDICNLVGGAAHGDTIKVKAADGYGEMFDYENVYTPVARQGKMVICWWKDGQYTGTWTEGMLLAFFTTVGRTDGKLLFGHQDMHDCLPEANWHWYYDNSIQYPSTHGLYINYISEMSVYSGGTEGWEVDVEGHLNDTVPQDWFENAIACHHMGATYVDSGNNTWQGLPLWYMVGLVDDGNIHGAGAFNDTVAAAGYTVNVIGSSGNCSFSSSTAARNNNIILANTFNGAPLSMDYYPLRLVGSDVPGYLGIGNITEIQLLNLPPVITASNFSGTGGSISPDGDIVLSPGGSQVFNITANSGYHISDVVVDGASVGAVVTYAFTDVTGYHTIVAYIVGDTCIITASAGSGGSISPSGAVAVNYGNSQLFNITPTAGYRILGVTVDGLSVGAVSSYTFTSVTTAHTISASFIPAWDINGDHVCDIGDVVKIGLVWSQTGSNGWIVEDVSPDGVIDIGDVVVIGLKWGKTW